jgi:hypothetical protein
MPDLSKFLVPLYSADQPYHWEYDNLPLQTLAERDEIINFAVDLNSQILSDCSGTQGTLANRLAQSIDADGNLIPQAVDQSEHNIAEHSDGTKTVTDLELTGYQELGFPSLINPVPFVRMLQAERDKLSLMANEATNMTVSVQTISNIVLFEQGPINFVESDSIQWQVDAPDNIKAVLKVSTDFAHRHYYDQTPVMLTGYQNYKVNSMATPYIEDSLRIYLNGVRLSKYAEVYYPDSMVSNWMLNSYTEDYANGKFNLTNAITSSDVIQIDYDISLT